MYKYTLTLPALGSVYMSNSILSPQLLLITVAHQRWTGLYGGGWGIKEESDKSMLHTKRRVSVCACVHVCVSVPIPVVASREPGVILQSGAGIIRGAISSAALPLIGLIIIPLTYCTAICAPQLQRLPCKLRSSFSAGSLYKKLHSLHPSPPVVTLLKFCGSDHRFTVQIIMQHWFP